MIEYKVLELSRAGPRPPLPPVRPAGVPDPRVPQY
jgi:hypothetical protein